MLRYNPFDIIENKVEDRPTKIHGRTAPFLDNILDEHCLHNKGIMAWQLSGT